MKTQLLTFSVLLAIGPCLSRAADAEYARSPDGIPVRKSPEQAVIVGNGREMHVTISPNASAEIRKTAAYVAQTLGKMSGRQIAVTEGTEAKGIVIGTLDQFPDAKVTERLAPFGGLKYVEEFPVATDVDADGRRRWAAVEAFAIRTDAGSVRLLGRSDAAAQRAAARFLELLGARRFTPSPVWEVVPKRAEIRFDAEEEQSPDFHVRAIEWGFGPNPQPKAPEGEFNTLQSWKFMNRLGGAFTPRTHHMYFTARSDETRKAEIDANKDRYYALLNGSRKAPGMFCLSQPRMRELIGEATLASFNTKAGDRYLMSSAEPPDGGFWCQCEACAAMGSRSTRAFLVANEVAVKAEKWRPGAALIGINAYNMHVDPPDIPIEPNVFTLLATKMDLGRLAMDDLLEIWPKKMKEVGLYDYFSTFVWGQDRVRGGLNSYVPAANPLGLTKQLRGYYHHGFRSLLSESVPNFALYGPGYYVASRVMWNIKADPNALLSDYYEKAFGPAANQIRGFYETFVDNTAPRSLHQNTFARVVALLDEADAAANGNPEVQARIAHLKSYMIGEYFQYHSNNHLKDKEKRKPWMFRMFAHTHQTRFDWVNHSRAWVQIAQKSDKNFDEPTWVTNYKTPAPWQEKDSLSSEDLAALWQEAKDFWKPVPAEEKTFSDRLKIVNRPDTEVAPQPVALAADGIGYFFNPDGRPLKFQLTFAKPGEDSIASVRVYDAAGNELFRHREELTKGGEAKSMDMEVKVPAPGEYTLTVKKGGYAKVLSTPGLPFFHRRLNFTIFTPNNYFYVPADVETIDCYIHDKATKVRPLGGSPIVVEPNESRITRIEVPEEHRGKVWSTTCSDMVFLNIPNIIFYNPAEILVPEEVKVD